ncbi:tRNA (guanine(26)-n(2))-dimethyltransferase [Plakobranchus ocellatus]|uniref:tRNA (Guanine(26)-n(2))-dimethyltransferase n=1 Tax=Plakobranchus ocellatus TaxID=259542 RepID=A0AAV4ABF6_9GAST|nr:tRNA (guanine(26)-n(2))-dimethyltransferase [Plakobranchus ocellatus]
MGLGAKFCELTSLLLAENECPSSVEITPEKKLLDCVALKNGNSHTIGENQPNKSSQEPSSMVSIESVTSGDVVNKQTDQQDHRHLSGKRQFGDTDTISSGKRQKLDCGEEVHALGVPFYYNIKKLRATVTHKLNKLVTILRSKGHRASRTHFDPCAIRTSASVPQFLQIMD